MTTEQHPVTFDDVKRALERALSRRKAVLRLTPGHVKEIQRQRTLRDPVR